MRVLIIIKQDGQTKIIWPNLKFVVESIINSLIFYRFHLLSRYGKLYIDDKDKSRLCRSYSILSILYQNIFFLSNVIWTYIHQLHLWSYDLLSFIGRNIHIIMSLWFIQNWKNTRIDQQNTFFFTTIAWCLETYSFGFYRIFVETLWFPNVAICSYYAFCMILS